jgi:predicted Zn-dependent protease
VRYRLAVPIAALIASLLLPLGSAGAAESTCSRPQSDAQTLYILGAIDHGNYKYYWWDDASLTIAIRANPQLPAEYVKAIERAIATWSTTLQECLGGQVSLTYAKGPRSVAQADIVLNAQLAPAGGLAFNGVARCSPTGCQTVMLSIDPPPGLPYEPLSLEEAYRLAIHEIGHALGLGHAIPIESYDAMGYGGRDDRAPFVISRCDVDALAYIWSWALEDGQPAPPTDPIYECSIP